LPVIVKTAPVWVCLPAVPDRRVGEVFRAAGGTLAEPAVLLDVPAAAPPVLLPAGGLAGLDDDAGGVDEDGGAVVAPPEGAELGLAVVGAGEPVGAGAGVVDVADPPVAGPVEEPLEDDAEVVEDGCWPRAWATRYMSGSTFSTSEGAAFARA
jgi:hypothetical protein